jgi:Spy/CpxP family protein refolding chaperone
MHPAFYYWWKNARKSGDEGCGARAECGPSGDTKRGFGHGHGHGSTEHFGGHDEPFGSGGPFGVRRPLRFLAHKLELSDAQVEELARVLNELKTERAQAEVDHQRTIAAFADAIEGATFDEAKAAEGGQKRVESAEKLRTAVVRALGRIHATLDDGQRKKLSYLVRTGTIAV